MRYLFTFLLCMNYAFAVDLKLPVEVKGQVAGFVPVKAETNGKTVKWMVLDSGLNLFPTELLKDTKTAVVSAGKPGRYRLLAVTASGDEPSDPQICVVIVGDAPIPPPKPDDPDTPETDLSKSIKSAWASDTSPEKSKHAKALASLYRQAPTVLDSVQTSGQLYATLKASANTLVPETAIKSIREVIAKELVLILPTDPQVVLADQHKNQARAYFAQIADILEGLK